MEAYRFVNHPVFLKSFKIVDYCYTSLNFINNISKNSSCLQNTWQMIERSADIYKSCIFDLTAFNLVGRISRLQFGTAELYSLIPPTLSRRHYACVEFREFAGRQALQYSVNFAFRMKVIDDAQYRSR